MIVRKGLPWLRLLLVWKSSTLPHIWLRLVSMTALAGVVTIANVYLDISTFSLTLTPFTLTGLALGIFLGFRNNTSYDRFWEGRKLWGGVVNNTRNAARQCLIFIGSPHENDSAPVTDLQRDLIYRLIAYSHSLRLHLRGQKNWTEELKGLLPTEEIAGLPNESNPPTAILHSIGRKLRSAHLNGWLDTYHFAALENSLTQLTNLQGGCERIKSTPIPFSYTVLIHRIVAVYCLALPFGIVNITGIATPLVVLMVSYAFLGLDAIGDEIEDPFGQDHNDLPLSTISRMIEVNLRERLGEENIPPLLTPNSEGFLP